MDEVWNLILQVIVVMAAIIVVTAGVFAALRWLLGRRNALRVYGSDGEETKGIPFYVKKGGLVQETSYLETLAELTLSAVQVALDAKGEAQDRHMRYRASKTVSLSGGTVDDVEKLQRALAEAQKQDDTSLQWGEFEKVVTDYHRLQSYTGNVPDSVPVVSNGITVDAYVDYADVHYLNAPEPVSGSASVATKLAADGTLSESTTTIEDSTLKTLLEGVPAGEIIKTIPSPKPEKRAVDMFAPAFRLPAEAATAYEFSLEMERRYVRHTLWREVDHRKHAPPIPLSKHQEHWYRREYVADMGASRTVEEDNDEGNGE